MAFDKKIFSIEIGALIGNVGIMKNDGARLVQICCVKEPAGKEEAAFFELHYTFDKNYHLIGYKVTIEPETEIPSITGIYPGAFLYENEMHDLFGIKIKDINIDYKGTFYKLARPRPFNPESEKSDDVKENAELTDGKQG
jgi:ech hydrogenase subunit D